MGGDIGRLAPLINDVAENLQTLRALVPIVGSEPTFNRLLRCQVLSKLNTVAVQPGARTLDQFWECLSQPFNGVPNLLGVDIRGCVLDPALQHVELVQQICLNVSQSVIGEQRLEDLLGVRTTVWEQTDQTRSGGGLEDLDIGIEHR